MVYRIFINGRSTRILYKNIIIEGQRYIRDVVRYVLLLKIMHFQPAEKIVLYAEIFLYVRCHLCSRWYMLVVDISLMLMIITNKR